MKPLLAVVLSLSLAACGPPGEDPGGGSSEGGGGDAGSGSGGDAGSGSGGDAGSGSGSGSDGGDDTGGSEPDETWTFEGDRVDVWVSEDAGTGLRTYTLTTTHPLRDDVDGARSFSELEGDPLLRSGVLLTDALFAMAVEEARELAVSEVSDGAFAEPVACECWQTGAEWTWVWTRDIAYATELGLAWLDPERAARSLLFKLSRPKEGGELEIVQDTGTGGSWPVSTDRVAWARGAMAVLRVAEHEELRAATVEALAATAARDREHAYDARDGLYRGETSFLDWREQSYPAWTADDTVHIAMSKSLSTNLDHLFLLRSLEELTGEEHGADDLALAIDAAFWDGEVYRSYLTTELDPAPAGQQDLLATSLAVLDLGTHPEALERYPFGPYGPPVIWPQQQLVPVYHNRATWPFVTAYAVLAAREADNGAVFDAGLDALVRGAALNLSHMENFEVATGANWLEDGEYSGPVVNSRRQLWSVAGFLGAVAHGAFGLEGDGAGGLTGSPVRSGTPWLTEGATLQVGEVLLTLDAGSPALSEGALTELDDSDWTQLFGARTPEVGLTGSGDAVTLAFSSTEAASFDVYRDGELVESGATSPYSEVLPADTTACYTVVAHLVHPSQPSEPQCWWGEGYARIQAALPEDFEVSGGAYSEDHGRPHYGDWGEPDHTLAARFTPAHSGRHLVQVVYGNGAGGVSTGITAAVKRATVSEVGTGEELGVGTLVMPHLGEGDWGTWSESSFVEVELQAGVEVEVLLSEGWNMSYLEHYRDYVGGRGGGAEPSGYVNIAEVKLLYMGAAGP